MASQREASLRKTIHSELSVLIRKINDFTQHTRNKSGLIERSPKVQRFYYRLFARFIWIYEKRILYDVLLLLPERKNESVNRMTFLHTISRQRIGYHLKNENRFLKVKNFA